MTQVELDRLKCPRCGEHNRPGVKPLIEPIGKGQIVVCGVCGCQGLGSAFMPFLWERP